jgi:glycosyltransferase involved in cell wall biosynthesis
MPKVSVIIPTYKRTDYLKLTLENINQQTFRDFEVIVVDDGTPGDDNLLLCNGFENVRYKKISNSGGPAVPRNEGLKMAQGQYIAFVDDDDLWVEDKLQNQVFILDNEPDFGVVHGYCSVIDGNGHLTGEIAGRLRNPMQKHGYVFDDMVGNFTVMMPTPLIRREVIDKIGGFNTSMDAAGEDTEFFCRLAFYTKFYFIDKPIAYYRVHYNNISTANFNYNYLPLELFKMVNGLYRNQLLERNRFNAIRKRLAMRQMELVANWPTAKVAMQNCGVISPFWGLSLRLVYVFIKNLVSSKK